MRFYHRRSVRKWSGKTLQGREGLFVRCDERFCMRQERKGRHVYEIFAATCMSARDALVGVGMQTVRHDNTSVHSTISHLSTQTGRSNGCQRALCDGSIHTVVRSPAGVHRWRRKTGLIRPLGAMAGVRRPSCPGMAGHGWVSRAPCGRSTFASRQFETKT